MVFFVDTASVIQLYILNRIALVFVQQDLHKESEY